MRRRIIILIVLSYVVELIFTLFEFDIVVARPWHPFYYGHTYEDGSYWNGWVSDGVFVYGFMEMVARALIFLAAYYAVINKIALSLFIVCFWIELVDMLDYYLFRNDPWPFFPRIGNFGLEYNYVKLAIVCYYAWTDWNRKTS